MINKVFDIRCLRWPPDGGAHFSCKRLTRAGIFWHESIYRVVSQDPEPPMTKSSVTLGSWIVALLCIATIATTTIHRKEVIREREQEIASLRRELAEVKRDLFHQESVGNVMD